MRRPPTAAQRAYLQQLAASATPSPAALPVAVPAIASVPPPVSTARTATPLDRWTLQPSASTTARWKALLHWVREHWAGLAYAAVILLLMRIDAHATDIEIPPAPQADLAPLFAVLAFASLSTVPALAILLYGRHRTPRPVPQEEPAEAAPVDPLPEPQEQPEPVTSSLPAVCSTEGFATHPGRVRGHNEDAGTAFRIGSHQVAIVADGVGGMPLGGQASTIAVRAAERAIRYAWRILPEGKQPAPRILLQAAIGSAAARLAAHAVRHGIDEPRQGLRTTLMIVIATADHHHFAYIGDGGIFLVRADGSVDALMDPHKVEGGALNQLAASLGPFPHGTATFACAERKPGDLLIAGTDGVADRLQPRFYSDRLPGHLTRCDGDLSVAAARVLAIRADPQENGLFRFDDNMTLALIGDGEPRPIQQIAEAA